MAGDVKIYSTPACPFCRMTKNYLKEHKIPFTDINVAADPKAAKEMVDKSDQMGVPVIDIDGNIIVGFDKNALKAALGI